MATVGPTNLPAFFSTDADFESWVTGIHNALNTLGFVQTADTGQINLATVAKPAASNTAQGYEVWRFADTLQATVPVFIKVEYGSGGAATRPGLWITVGSGSSGAGALTGQLSARQQISPSNDKTAGATLPLYACNGGDGSSLSLACNVDTASTSFGFMFNVLRPRDNTGSPTNEGVVVALWNNNNGVVNVQFVPATGSVPAQLSNFFPAVSPYFFSRGSGGSNADACPMLLPLLGTWRYSKLMLIGASDFGAGGTFQCDIFGAAHTFLALDTTCGNINMGINGNGGNPGVAMAWE